MDYGYVKVASAVPLVKVADCKYNVEQTESQIVQAEGLGVEIIVFPELGITSCSCGDIFQQNLLLDAAEQAILHLLDLTRKLDIISIVGLPVIVNNSLLNCAMVIQKGQILGVVPKTQLKHPEDGWFVSGENIITTAIHYAGQMVKVTSLPQIFVTDEGVKFGIEMCDEPWESFNASSSLVLAGAELIFNLASANTFAGHYANLKSSLAHQSQSTATGYIYSSCGFGESTQDVVFSGDSLVFENGTLVAEGKRFSLKGEVSMAQIDLELLRSVRKKKSHGLISHSFIRLNDFSNTNMTVQNSERLCLDKSIVYLNFCQSRSIQRNFTFDRQVRALPFVPSKAESAAICQEVLDIQTQALGTRLKHINSKKVLMGISGGLDSTLTLLASVSVFDKFGLDRKNIIGVTMPGFGTTDRTYNNALDLMKSLGITIKEISIVPSVTQHFEDIGHQLDDHDVTYENSQARERTQILMDLANQIGGTHVGTGDLSELALGWATFNGDHMSMYDINGGVPKTLIRFIVRYYAENLADNEETKRILLDILDTPISPELIPVDEQGLQKQKTEDLVGPYELHDFFLYYFANYGFGPRKIFMLAQKAFGSIQKPSADGDAQDEYQKVGTYDDETIKKWLKVFFSRFFSQQFKRSCMPEGPQAVSVSLSPRGGWNMPSDISNRLWEEECDSL